MSREQDPNVGNIGDLEVEDPRTGKSSGGPSSGGDKRKAPSGGGPRKPAGGASPGGKGSGSGGQGPWLLVSLGLLALILVMGTWSYREISSLRSQLETGMDQSQQRLDNLESLLSATDETLSQSANSIQGRLKDQMGEIRKLWDVSNKRNRGWIKDNEKQLQALQNSAQELENSMKGVRGDIASLREEVEKTSRAQGKTRTQLDALADSVQQLEAATGRYEKKLGQLEDMREDWQGLQERLDKMDEAIAAFDRYRQQINQRLQALEENNNAASGP